MKENKIIIIDENSVRLQSKSFGEDIKVELEPNL